MPHSATFFIKRNDDQPSLDVALRDDRNRAVELAGATVLFHMRNTADDSTKIDSGSVTIIDASRGEVRYSWQSGDTDTEGNYEGEFEVTFAAGGVETFPNDSYIDIIIGEDVA